MSDLPTTIAITLLLLAPLLAGGLSLLLSNSRWLHVTNLTSIGTLVAAEVMIAQSVLAQGSLTAFSETIYIDALSSVILFIIGTVGLACSLICGRIWMSKSPAASSLRNASICFSSCFTCSC